VFKKLLVARQLQINRCAEDRFQDAAADGSGFVGNFVTLAPFQTRINVAGLHAVVHLNAADAVSPTFES